jgi:hypothetical protein
MLRIKTVENNISAAAIVISWVNNNLEITMDTSSGEPLLYRCDITGCKPGTLDVGDFIIIEVGRKNRLAVSITKTDCSYIYYIPLILDDITSIYPTDTHRIIPCLSIKRTGSIEKPKAEFIGKIYIKSYKNKDKDKDTHKFSVLGEYNNKSIIKNQFIQHNQINGNQ